MLVGMVLAIASGPALNSLALATMSRSRSAGGSAATAARRAGDHPADRRAVAVAGPIVFLGLLIPHAVRFAIGPTTVAAAVLRGARACLLLAADILGRSWPAPARSGRRDRRVPRRAVFHLPGSPAQAAGS